MAYFWLQDDDANVLNLDDNIQELTLGGNKRNYSFVDFVGANGSSIRGWGSYSQKEFIFTRKERAEGTDATAWNSRRNDFMTWATKPRHVNIWLYLKDGEGSNTMRTKVFFEMIPEDKYKYYRISDQRAFKLVSPSGSFENTTATTGSSVYAAAVTNNPETIVNNGVIDCPIILEYTPTATTLIFKVTLYENFGFTLTFTGLTSGQKIAYNTLDGSLTINGLTRDATQYLTSGSLFNLPTGSNILNVSADQPGTFSYTFNQRYI